VAQCHNRAGVSFRKIDDVSTRFPLDATKDESDLGFTLEESPTGERALVLALANGLRAVKVSAQDGGTEYAVCNERFEPLYIAAKTLDELRSRFRRKADLTIQ
jgi:hypothetical protein